MKPATLIIGAGPGLGAALARRFARNGDQIILAARNPEGLGDICDDIGAMSIACDASDPDDVQSLFERLDAEGLTLSTMIYNAGYYARGAVTDLDPADVEKVWKINAFGAFLCANQASKRMLESGTGTMLFTGASAGVKGYANSSAFAMGKFALRGLCQSLARELAPQNIHVAHFMLDGLIHAPSRGAPYDDPAKCLDPDDIAESYFNIADQPKSAWTWEQELRPWSESF
uniref:SDR family NAD(P)-dependent oxidoreductase n=1 Tax=uncultured Altererythrobacter sp. TaxID=500840 RepID=UPI00261B8B04|nr:SDR family NAD(P)-dependent oxidoreductase [uncultured Altererythrobacter sp.]